MPQALVVIVPIGIVAAPWLRIGIGHCSGCNPATARIIIAGGAARVPPIVGTVIAVLRIVDPAAVAIGTTSGRSGDPAAVAIIIPAHVTSDPAPAIIVITGRRARDPLIVTVVIAIGRGRHPVPLRAIIAVVGLRSRGLHPAIVGVVIAVRRAVHPIAIAVIITGRQRRIDPGRMPAVVFVVIAIGAAAIRIGLGHLVANDSADDCAGHRAKRLVAFSCDHITGHAADDCAANRCCHPGGALALAALLCRSANRDHCGCRHAGDDEFLGHLRMLLTGTVVPIVKR